jgi:hypothetical protein
MSAGIGAVSLIELVLMALLVFGGALVIVGVRVAASSLSMRSADTPSKADTASTRKILLGLAAAALGGVMLVTAYLTIDGLTR